MKTAAELEAMGIAKKRRDDLVPYIYPSQVERFVERQIPFIVVRPIPRDDEMIDWYALSNGLSGVFPDGTRFPEGETE